MRRTFQTHDLLVQWQLDNPTAKILTLNGRRYGTLDYVSEAVNNTPLSIEYELAEAKK